MRNESSPRAWARWSRPGLLLLCVLLGSKGAWAATTLTAQHSQRCVDVPGGSPTAGTALQQYGCNGHVAQQFDFESNGDGTYVIRPRVNVNDCLDSNGGGAVVHLGCWKGPNQRWKLQPQSDGTHRLTSTDGTRCMSVSGASTLDGAQLITDSCATVASNARFALAGTLPGGSGPPPSVPNGLETAISAPFSGRCLDVINGNGTAGTALQQYACLGNAAQQFKFEDNGDGTYVIRPRVNLNDCLDSNGGGAVVHLGCWKGPNQKWKLPGNTDGTYLITSTDGTRCLLVSGASTANGAQIVTSTCAGAGANARFRLPALASGGGGPVGSELAKSADAFVDSIGVNLHLENWGTIYDTRFADIIKPKLAASGIRHVRDGGMVFNDNGWMSAVYSRYTQVATQLGRRIGFNLILTPPDHSCDMNNVPLTRLLQFFNAAHIDAFEGMNERDNNPPCSNTGNANQWAIETATFQRALYTTVKGNSATASIPVYGPSYVHGRTSATTIGDLTAYMTYANQHSYSGGQVPQANIQSDINNLWPTNGSRPYVATETGYHNFEATTSGHPGVSERASGKYMSRLFFEYFNAGVARSYIYEFIDEPNQRDLEAHFGLLRADGSEKPAFVAVKNLITVLQDPGVAFTPGSLRYSLSTTGLHHTLLQKRDGRFYLVLWQNLSTYDRGARRDIDNTGRVLPVTVTLGAVARQVHQIDPLLASTPFSSASNVQSLTVSVGDQALILEIVP